MFDTETESQERGQVGIGTLIVFIALVLVAAIAAGVLINTAGFLQTQAEATGEESTQQVSDRVVVETAIGTDDTADGATIDISELTVSQAPGADFIDLSDATIEVLPDGGSAQILTVDANSLDVEDLDGNSYNGGGLTEGDLVLSESDDRLVLVLDSTVTEAEIGAFDQGDTVEITITTEAGGQTVETLSVPEHFEAGASVRL